MNSRRRRSGRCWNECSAAARAGGEECSSNDGESTEALEVGLGLPGDYSIISLIKYLEQLRELLTGLNSLLINMRDCILIRIEDFERADCKSGHDLQVISLA